MNQLARTLMAIGLFFLFYSSAYAQELGVKIGLNASTINRPNWQRDEASLGVGWQIGGYIIPFKTPNHVYAELQIANQNFGYTNDTRMRTYFTQLFILGKIAIKDSPARFIGGFGASYFMGGDLRYPEKIGDTRRVESLERDDKLDYSIPAVLGLMLDFKKIKVDFRGEFDLYREGQIASRSTFALSLYYTGRYIK